MSTSFQVTLHILILYGVAVKIDGGFRQLFFSLIIIAFVFRIMESVVFHKKEFQ